MDPEVPIYETTEKEKDTHRLEMKVGLGVYRDRGHRLHGNEDQVPLHQTPILDIDESFRLGIVTLLRIMILLNTGMIQIGVVVGREAHHIHTLQGVDISKDISILLPFVVQSQTIILLNGLLLPLQPDSNIIQTLNL